MYHASLDAIRNRPIDYLDSRLDAFKFSSDHLLDAGYGNVALRVIRPVYRVAFIDVRSGIDLASWFHPLFGPGMVIVYPSLVVVLAMLLCCWELGRTVRRVVRRVATPTDVLITVGAFTALCVVVTPVPCWRWARTPVSGR